MSMSETAEKSSEKSGPKSSESLPDRPCGREGDANPGSRAARQIRAAEFEAMRSRVAELEALILDRERTDAGRAGATVPITAEVMRRVFNQLPESDRGPAEGELRRWLAKDVKGYLAEVADREAAEAGVAGLREENECLRERLGELEAAVVSPAEGPDAGSERSLKLIEEYFENPERWEKP